MKLHHKGIAVSNMELSKQKYQKTGYKIINEVYDETQSAYLVLMTNGQETIELIFSKEKKSPVYNLCKQAEETFYHNCYEVAKIEKAIEKFKKNGYIKFTEIQTAKLFNGKICFMYSKEKGITELYEIHI